MDSALYMNKYLNLKFESNNQSVEIGKMHPYRLLSITGIESGSLDISTSSNVGHDGSIVLGKKIIQRHIKVEAEYIGQTRDRARSRLISFFNIHNGGYFYIDYMVPKAY